jgi:hypothetical protein
MKIHTGISHRCFSEETSKYSTLIDTSALINETLPNAAKAESFTYKQVKLPVIGNRISNAFQVPSFSFISFTGSILRSPME